MKNFKSKTIYVFIIAVIAITVFVIPVSASSTDGAIDSTYKYAWTENIGWLNFGTTEGNIHITDSVLTGYAWAENIGWISLNCSNDNSCSTVDYGVANDGAGNLSGYAWSENAGWLNFNPAYGGVTINSSGEFLGYAWGENIGWIVFNCSTTNSCATVDYKVKTDWRPQSARPQCNNSSDDDGDGKTDYPNDPGCSSLTDTDETDSASTPAGGGLPPDAYNPPTSPSPAPDNPEGKFSILINNGDKYANNQTVKLRLNAGSNTQRMAISNSPDFKNASQIPYQKEIPWDLNYGIASPSARNDEYTVYAKFYTQYGVASEVVSDSIILDTIPPEVKITNLKDYYSANEKIVLSGATEPNAKIAPRLDGKYSGDLIKADNSGSWTLNLGKLSAGIHKLELKAKDLAENIGETLIIDLVVKEKDTSPLMEETETPKLEKAPKLTEKDSKSVSQKPAEILTETPKTETPKPETPAQLPQQPLTPPSSKPLVEEPKTPPPFSEPSEPPKPTEPSQPKLEEPTIPTESPKQPSLISDLWQPAKMTFKNISSTITTGFNNLGKKIAGLFNKSKNSFIAFTEDVKTLGNKIKLAIFKNSQPLQISDLKVVPLSPTSVEIVWQTNHKATSKVNYGLSRIYDLEKQDSKKTKNHSVILTDLKPKTTYHYEVISQNGGYVYDADRIFVTSGE